jgi:oligoribonuclease NrnB/cAMP/cGMP phosphodiesterase (DHH superfamily)
MKRRGIISEEYTEVEKETQDITESAQQDSIIKADSSVNLEQLNPVDSLKQEAN